MREADWDPHSTVHPTVSVASRGSVTLASAAYRRGLGTGPTRGSCHLPANAASAAVKYVAVDAGCQGLYSLAQVVELPRLVPDISGRVRLHTQ